MVPLPRFWSAAVSAPATALFRVLPGVCSSRALNFPLLLGLSSGHQSGFFFLAAPVAKQPLSEAEARCLGLLGEEPRVRRNRHSAALRSQKAEPVHRQTEE